MGLRQKAKRSVEEDGLEEIEAFTDSKESEDTGSSRALEGLRRDLEKARDTLRNVHRLWRRPVHLETVEDDRGRLLSFDGSEHKSTRL